MPAVQEIEAGAGPRGGYTARQLAEWGVPWPPPKGWKKALLTKARQGERVALARTGRLNQVVAPLDIVLAGAGEIIRLLEGIQDRLIDLSPRDVHKTLIESMRLARQVQEAAQKARAA